MKKIISLICLGSLAGCATSSSTMLDERTALITAGDQGWGMDLSQKLLQTAARMAQQRGFSAFQFIDETSDSRQGVVVLPGSSTTNASAACTGSFCTGTATTTGTPAQAVPYDMVRRQVMVRFLRDEEITPDMKGVIRAASVLSSN